MPPSRSSASRAPRWVRRTKYILVGVVIGYLFFALLESRRCSSSASSSQVSRR